MPDFNSLILSAPFLSFLAVFIAAMPARRFALACGLIDHPGGRKNHDKPVPPIGGLLIFPVFMGVAIIFGADLKTYWPLYVSLIILLMTGALDDRFSLPALMKFIAHFSAAAIMVFFGGCQVAYLGDLFGLGVVWTGFLSYPFSMIAIVLLTNALNLVDGLDGLAGGMAGAMFAFMMIAAFAAGFTEIFWIIAILLGALCGFMVFNMRNPWRRRASMFLGDSGSMCLGLTIAWFAIHLAKGPNYPLEPIAVAWIIGFPIFDACAQFYRRVRAGQDPFAPDRGHFHHLLTDAGFSVTKTVMIILALVAVMGLIGVVGSKAGIPFPILTGFWIGGLLFHMIASNDTENYKAKLGSAFSWLEKKSEKL